MSTMQTLKSSLVVREDPGKSQNAAGHRMNLGEQLFCSASSQNINHDVYGRPASQNTLGTADGFFTLEPSCPQYSQFSAQRMIGVESNNRPYIPVAAAGLRGSSDLMGKGRHLMPQDLYGSGLRGNFIRTYPTANNASFDYPTYPMAPRVNEVIQPYDYSHSTSAIGPYPRA